MRYLYGENIGKEIPDDRVRFYDGILHIIYKDRRKRVFLDAEFDDPVSLADIYRKRPNVEKVIFETPLQGWIYSCGNHVPGGWEMVGETVGYA